MKFIFSGWNSIKYNFFDLNRDMEKNSIIKKYINERLIIYTFIFKQ